MLKKWKRWKLGKDIDEEYRHTHSHTPHIKSGSIATGNLPYLHDNNTSDPSGDSPRLNKADRAPSCSAAPEENRRLVVSYSNGTGKGRPAKSRHALQFSFLPRRVATSHISTATEDVCLEEKAQCRSYPPEGEETNVWEQPPLGPHHLSRKLSHWLCLSWFLISVYHAPMRRHGCEENEEGTQTDHHHITLQENTVTRPGAN